MEGYEKNKISWEDNVKKGKYNLAEELLDVLVVNPTSIDFLTIPGYKTFKKTISQKKIKTRV
jgi:malate synthase